MWNRKKLGIIAVVLIAFLLIFGGCTADMLSSCSATQEPTQSETTSADDSDASKAEESQTSAEQIAELQAQIDELNNQLSEKDSQLAEKDAQIQRLQNTSSGDVENGGVTFQKFLNLYFWPDGNTYRLYDDKKLYSNYACTDEYELNTADYTFPCDRSLQINMESGLSVYMLMTTDGQIVWSPSPYFTVIDD